jgi:hypothetical protein
MFEEWVRREEVLKLFQQVCAQCPVLSRDEIERLEGARRFGRATGFERQWQYATLDPTLSLQPQAVNTIASALSATPALSVRPLVLRMRILHPCVTLANLKVQPGRCPESHHGGL